MRLIAWIRRQLHKLPSGRHRGWDQHVLYGRWYVRYNKDGKRTHPMFYDTAKSYAAMFGGTVHHEDEENTPCDCD